MVSEKIFCTVLFCLLVLHKNVASGECIYKENEKIILSNNVTVHDSECPFTYVVNVNRDRIPKKIPTYVCADKYGKCVQMKVKIAVKINGQPKYEDYDAGCIPLKMYMDIEQNEINFLQSS